LSPDHPLMAMHLANLAALLVQLRDYDGAKAHALRALAVSEKALGRDHPTTGKILYNLGEHAAFRGDDAGARPLLERALRILERPLGPHDLILARVRNELADLLARVGEPERAWSLHLQAFRGVARGRRLLNAGPLPEVLKLSHAEESNR